MFTPFWPDKMNCSPSYKSCLRMIRQATEPRSTRWCARSGSVEVTEHEEDQDVHNSCKCIDGRTATIQAVEKANPRRGGRSLPGVVSRKRSACLEFTLGVMDTGCPHVGNFQYFGVRGDAASLIANSRSPGRKCFNIGQAGHFV